MKTSIFSIILLASWSNYSGEMKGENNERLRETEMNLRFFLVILKSHSYFHSQKQSNLVIKIMNFGAKSYEVVFVSLFA
jgi:hypothetical protein